jgi:putative transposase
MRKSRFTPEQILQALRQAESGTPVVEICRKLGVTETTFYHWEKQYGGLDTSELRGLRQLREENRRLKQLVADLTLDKTILNDALGKKMVSPVQRRAVVAWAQQTYRVSERRACLPVSRSVVPYESVKPTEAPVRHRLHAKFARHHSARTNLGQWTSCTTFSAPARRSASSRSLTSSRANASR